MSRHIFMLVMAVLMLLMPQIALSQDDEGEIFIDPNQPEIDSLLNIINPNLPDSVKAIIYSKVSKLTCNYDTCLKYRFLSLDFCNETYSKNDSLIANNYSNIANAYYMKDESRKALQYRFMAADIYNKISNKRAEAITFLHIGNCFFDLNIKDSVFYYYNKALTYFTEIQDTFLLISSYNTLGALYYNMSLYTNAEENFRKALDYTIAKKDTVLMARCYCYLGRTIELLSDTATNLAMQYLRKSVRLFDFIESVDQTDVEEKHNAYWGLADTYIKMAKKTGAKAYADSCYMFIKKASNYFMSVSSNCNYVSCRYCYVDYLIFYKKYREALRELLGLEKYLTEDRFASSHMPYYNYLYEVYSYIGDYKNALACHEKYLKYRMEFVNDSTLNSIKDAEVERTHMLDSLNHHYETLRIKAEHEQEIKRKQGEVYIILSVFAVVLLVSVILFRWYRTSRQKNELMLKHKALEIERTLLRSQMNPHFIFNAMNSIQHFIATNQTNEAERYLSKFAKLIRFVLDSSMKQSVPLADEIQFLSFYLDIEQVRFTGKFTYKFDIDDNVEEDFIGVPPMLLQPLIENSIVHGVMHKEDGMGQITIRIEEYDKDTLRCSVIDNGIGRKASAILNQERNKTHKSIGMQLTRERLKDLNKPENAEKAYVVTDLEDENGKALGTKTTILMPVYDI